MNGWEIQTISANGGTASTATVIQRTSPWTIVSVTNDSSDYAVQLPITNFNFGDVVEVCAGSDIGANPVSVWLGTTVANSSTTHYEQFNAGQSRKYRYISGSYWNRYD